MATGWRIVKSRYASTAFDGEGARLYGGRWNSSGTRMVYSLESAVADYTGEALDGYDREDVAGLLENRLEKARERLEETRETVRALCEPVPLPRNTIDYIHYFCAEDTADKDAVKANECKRVALYKSVSSFVCAYANHANEMPYAGDTPVQADDLRVESLLYE